MIEHTYQVLGYYRLLEILSRYASSTLGQSKCLSLKPSTDSTAINNELRLVSEMRLLLKTKGFLTFSDLIDVSPLLRKSKASGSYLEPDELLTILRLAESGQASERRLRSERSLCPGLASITDGMPNLEALVKELKGTIAPNGEIRDRATPLLGKIRHTKRRQRTHLEKKLDDIRRSRDLGPDGHDRPITLRDGRYVISVRSDQKSRINGIIHDYSRTKATCFVEPVEVIQDNNRSAELALEERAEEHRILVSLTGAVRDLAPDIAHVQALIARLDELYAKGRYGETFSCVAPEIAEGYSIRLKNAKNPILLALSEKQREERKGVPVPVDISLEKDRSLLIISGPNRGGKTVTLKTLGLMTLMVQTGIHIPAAEGSCLPVFEHCLADIGDDQDIQTGLSTFSAHAAHMKQIVELADKKSLIIIDEPGMGTDPNEGAALSMAVLDDLSRKGAFVALATHLNRLKTYGLLQKSAVNASVEFDQQENRPTFRLRYGSPGISHALETAHDMGMPSEILDSAREYLDQDEVRLNRLIEKMHGLIAEVEAERIEAEAARRRHHSASKELEEGLSRLEAEKTALIAAKRLEAEEALKGARKELKDAINLLKGKKKSSQADVTKRYGEIRRGLFEYFEPERDTATSSSSGVLREGQTVFHRKLKREGFVQSVDSSGGRASVMLGTVKVSADTRDLQVLNEGKDIDFNNSSRSVIWKFRETEAWESKKGGSRPAELNVIGYRVNDAIPLIDSTMDRALVEGRLSVTIIHGFGTGRLRGAIRDHLRGIPFVKAVNSAEPGLGGDGVTVVQIG